MDIFADQFSIQIVNGQIGREYKRDRHRDRGDNADGTGMNGGRFVLSLHIIRLLGIEMARGPGAARTWFSSVRSLPFEGVSLKVSI